jgi:DNA-binding transcriptional LysR family regulator
MDISFRHLEIFVTVAKFKSISKAAEELYLSQSAVSMALSEFEKRIGVNLFDRANKKFFLNNYGEKVFFQAQNIISMLHELKNVAKCDDFSGKLSIGATQTIGNYVVPYIISSFKKQFPKVKIFLYVENTEQILKKLMNFEIDLAFVEGVVELSDVDIFPWMKDEIVVFSAPNYPLAKKNKITINDLKKEKWILREKGSGTRDIFQREIVKKIKDLDIYLEIGHTEAIKKMVEAGIGIGCLSELTVKRELELGLLKKLEIPFKILRKFQIVVHKKKFLTQLLQKFITFSKKNFHF